MAFLKFGQEGEIIPHQVTPNVAYANVDNRGGTEFIYDQWSQTAVGPVPELWWHGKFATGTTGLAATNTGSTLIPPTNKFFGISDSNGIELIHFEGYWNDWQYRKWRIVGIANDTSTSTVLYDFGAYAQINTEVTVDLHASLVGSTLIIEAYVNGSLIASRTVVGTAPVWGQPTLVSYGRLSPRDSDGNTIWWETAASTTPTLGIGLSTLEATTQGFHTTGSGSYLDVSENGVNLSTSLSLNNVGDKESWVISPLAGKSFGTSGVKNITASALVVHNGGTVTGYRYFIRSLGIDYPTAGGTIIPTAQIDNYVEEISINPATGAAFTAAEVAAGIEIGIEAV